MIRNRDETRQRILDATLDLLSAEGFGALGINAVARRAGADKQLIYRYFGGLDGLLAAAGTEVATRLARALDQDVGPAGTYAALIEALAGALLSHLLRDPLFRQLRLMEASAPSPATEAFQLARGRVLTDWLQARRGDLPPPKGVDLAAVNAVAIAAIEGLAILGPAGIPRDEAADRLMPVLGQMLRGALDAG